MRFADRHMLRAAEVPQASGEPLRQADTVRGQAAFTAGVKAA
jgi:hypothetical protein